jgi:hypothetical protein
MISNTWCLMPSCERCRLPSAMRASNVRSHTVIHVSNKKEKKKKKKHLTLLDVTVANYTKCTSQAHLEEVSHLFCFDFFRLPLPSPNSPVSVSSLSFTTPQLFNDVVHRAGEGLIVRNPQGWYTPGFTKEMYKQKVLKFATTGVEFTEN